MFVTKFWQMKEKVLARFGWEEVDDELQIVTAHLFTPDPNNTGQYLEVYDMAGLEKAVATFQSLLKFRRPQITRKRIKSVAAIVAAYVPDSSARPLRKSKPAEIEIGHVRDSVASAARPELDSRLESLAAEAAAGRGGVGAAPDLREPPELLDISASW